MRAVADHFSQQADIYAQARPQYPSALFADLHNMVTARFDDTPWIADIGAGSGQATHGLVPLFPHILAIDPIASIIARCPHLPHVHRLAARAERLPLSDGRLHGILCAQSAHWFDLPAFHAEMRRVCHRQAPVAFVTYGRTRVSPEVDHLMDVFEEKIGPYWPAGRQHVDTHYEHLAIEFPILERRQYPMQLTWTRYQFMAYVRSWSSVTAYQKTHGHSDITALAAALGNLWPDAMPVSWPLTAIFTAVGEND